MAWSEEQMRLTAKARNLHAIVSITYFYKVDVIFNTDDV